MPWCNVSALYGPWTHKPPLRYRNGQGLSVARTCANDTSAMVDLPRSPQPSLASLATLASLASLASLTTLTIRFARFARLLAQTPVHAPERFARHLTSSTHTCLQRTPAARSLCSLPHQQLPHLARFARLLRRSLRSPTHRCSLFTSSPCLLLTSLAVARACCLPRSPAARFARFTCLSRRTRAW